MFGDLKEHFHAAQDQMKKFADREWRELEFQVNDLVFLKFTLIDG